jgi:two-component system CheB/CheR fusion protein
MNDELNDRSLDLNEANAFLGAVLGSLQAGVVVVDRDLVVNAWNDAAHDLWGLRTDEVVGKHLLNLDIGLPLDSLRDPIRETITSESGRTTAVAARDRRGRDLNLHVSLMPLLSTEGGARGVILLMQPDGSDGASWHQLKPPLTPSSHSNSAQSSHACRSA